MTDHRETTMLSRVADNLYWMSVTSSAPSTPRASSMSIFNSGSTNPHRRLRPMAGPARSSASSGSGKCSARCRNPDSSSHPRSRESIVDYFLCRGRPRKSSPGPRAVQLRNVGATQSPLSASQEHRLQRRRPADSHGFFRAVQDGAHLFQGITDSTMSHGEGWHYIQLGRFVERTEAVARLIGAHFSRFPHPLDQAVESEEYLEWVGLLKSCAAFQAYCKAHTAELRPLRVAEFLLLNPGFPHSVAFSVDRFHAALTAIAELTERKAEQPVRIAGRLRATLSFSQIDEIMASGAIAYVDSIRWQCAQAHAAIQQVYFDYSVESALVA
jgi:uncharacterized alpha-E superfamily protein